MPSALVTLARGIANTNLADVHLANTRFSTAWTNVNYSQPTISGNEPITFLLRCLLSTKTGGNYPGSGTNYDDVVAVGSGLGT